jgi:hypothetical protein
MNKIIIMLVALAASVSVAAQINFQMTIPQPDFISNDWDNDGIPNAQDNDDDNDGILDEDDSSDFDHDGQSSVPNVVINGFSPNKFSYHVGEELTLNWDLDNVRSLNLYGDVNLSDYLGDVTLMNSFNVFPTGDQEYYLDTETSIISTSVFQFNEVSRDCETWAPLENTVPLNDSFEQTRDCLANYESLEPSTDQLNKVETQMSYGTLLPNVIVNSFNSSKKSYFPGEELTLSWDVDNIRSLNLFGDVNLSDYLGDVTSSSSMTVTPSGNQSYYLDTETEVVSTSVYSYNHTSTTCNDPWLPLASTVNSGVSFQQSRNCTLNYTSSEPSATTKPTTQTQQATGTKEVMVCVYTGLTFGASDQFFANSIYSSFVAFPDGTYVYGPIGASSIVHDGYTYFKRGGYRIKQNFGYGDVFYYELCKTPLY